jgi:hypothetical protein
VATRPLVVRRRCEGGYREVAKRCWGARGVWCSQSGTTQAPGASGCGSGCGSSGSVVGAARVQSSWACSSLLAPCSSLLLSPLGATFSGPSSRKVARIRRMTVVQSWELETMKIDDESGSEPSLAGCSGQDRQPIRGQQPGDPNARGTAGFAPQCYTPSGPRPSRRSAAGSWQQQAQAAAAAARSSVGAASGGRGRGGVRRSLS